MEQTGGNKNITTMKKFKLIYALLAVTLFVTACNDEEFLNQGKVPAADGSEVLFGGRAGFENSNAKGRTVYSGEEYSYGGKDFERIDWIDGDMIEIYSPEASNGPSAHYKVTSITTGDEDKGTTGKGSDYAYLERLGESALQWNGDDEHNFYAMYPSSQMFAGMNGITVPQGLSMDKDSKKVLVNGVIPSSQDGKISDDGKGNYTIAPNMKYAYMVAKTKADRSDESVGLSFVPIVTALEIEMSVPADSKKGVSMSNIQIQGKGIAGKFTADLSGWNMSGYPTCTNEATGEDYVNISTMVNYNPITINAGNSIKFVVFLRPGADYSDLKVCYAPGAVFVSKSLKDVTVSKNLKTQISNLYLPATYDKEIVVDASKWMSQLPKTTKMKKLSIPGTGGSFSYNYTADNTGIYRGQHTHMDLDAQWKKGIRAFEIITDMQASSFANEKLKCNKKDMGLNVQTVVNNLLTKLSNTYNEETDMYETAMVIFTYQPEGNNPSRNPGTYMQKVMAYINTLDNARLVRYSPDLTLDEAENCLMIVVRPTQTDEDESTAWTNVLNQITGKNADKILAVNGCGTAKDRWGARGYEITTQKYTRTRSGSYGSYQYTFTYDYDTKNAPDISNYIDQESSRSYPTTGATATYDYYQYFETYMETEGVYALSTNNSYTIPNIGDGNLTVKRSNTKFNFETNAGYDCWFQEWQRVVKQNIKKESGRLDYGSYPTTYWFESLNEKYSNVVEAFEMSISDDYDYVFINSLCGYLASSVDETNDCLVPSVGNAWGGSSGNIKALADELNAKFYRYILDSGFEQKTGPTGVILMNYVNNTLDTSVQYDGSFHLPDVIIANNFKHSLEDDTTGGQGGGNQSGGGDDTGDGGEI